jgi:hypothetical protein
MERECQERPYNARKYNLLGLALLRTDPQKAVDAFKNALRCDLHHGPAYLNLAQAHQQANDVFSAQRCLQRYLELMPYGIHATDARRRLAALGQPIVAGPGGGPR